MASNAMNDIYTKVCGALATLTGGTINWFEVDMNQEKKEGDELPITYPAVIFKHHDVIWADTATAQTGTVQMELKVIHEIKDNEQLLAYQPLGRSDETRRNVDLETIFNAINVLSGNTFNRLRRLNTKEEFINDNLQVINTSQYFCNIMSDASTPPATLTIDYSYIARLNELLKTNKCCK